MFPSVLYILATVSVTVHAHSAAQDPPISPQPYVGGGSNNRFPLVARCCSMRRPQTVMKEQAAKTSAERGSSSEKKTSTETSDSKSSNGAGGAGVAGVVIGLAAAYLL